MAGFHCLSVPEHIPATIGYVQTLPNFLRILPVAMARSTLATLQYGITLCISGFVDVVTADLSDIRAVHGHNEHCSTQPYIIMIIINVHRLRQASFIIPLRSMRYTKFAVSLCF